MGLQIWIEGLKMEAADSSETLVPTRLYGSTLRIIVILIFSAEKPLNVTLK
jgi:hypothetical protein